jgi:hypothetical protein
MGFGGVLLWIGPDAGHGSGVLGLGGFVLIACGVAGLFWNWTRA